MMRLAYISSYFPIKEQPHRGQSAFQTLLRMQDRVQIEAFCPLATYPRWAQPHNYPYTRTDLSWQPPGGLRAHYIEYPALPVVGRAWNGLVCARAIARQVAAFTPDVILNYWLYPEGWAAMHVGRALGVPVILGSIGSDLNRIPDRITGWWTQRALAGSSLVVTVSEHLRRRAIALGVPEGRARCVVNGVDTAIFHEADRTEARRELGLEPDARIVLYVGWIAPTKGLRELAAAFGALAPRHPRQQMLLIGEGTLRAELEQIGARFRLLGRRDSSEIARWMAAADLFCLPSWSEGCPNVVVEALACGRPVVSTAVGGIPELVDSPVKGTLVAPHDIDALTRALEDALARPWDEAAIARAARRDWSDCARETEALCREAISLHHAIHSRKTK
jgi:teichuronic acid biosynthesis glycosyltransferase TuaC